VVILVPAGRAGLPVGASEPGSQFSLHVALDEVG
jgi:hypothetical protein